MKRAGLQPVVAGGGFGFVRAGLVLAIWLSGQGLLGTELVWDGDLKVAGPQDGGGMWNLATSNTNWWYWDVAAAPRNVCWNNGGVDARFGVGTGSAGTVTIAAGTTIQVRHLRFAAAGAGGYALAAANPTTSRLELVASPTVTVDEGLVATVGVVMTGTGFSKSGAGTLALAAVNTLRGDVTVGAGTIALDATSTFGTGTGRLKLAGGRINLTLPRSGSAVAIANPILVTGNSQITTTSTGAVVLLQFTSSQIGGTAGSIEFRNDAGSGSGVFVPGFYGGGFTFSRPLAIENGAHGSIRLECLNLLGTTQVFSGPISGSGRFRRTATGPGIGGVTVFAGTNSYSGATEVWRGALLVEGELGSLTTTSVGGAGRDGTLGGNGVLPGPVVVQTSGTLSPGIGLGRLTIANNLELLAGSTTWMEVDGARHTNDSVAGLVRVAFGGVLHLTNLAGALSVNDTFKLFDATEYEGTFESVDPAAPGPGLAWDLSRLGLDGTVRVVDAGPATVSFDTIFRVPAGLVFTGRGGSPGLGYRVLASGDVTQPMSGWASILTGQFAADGSFAFTNVLGPDATWHWFAIGVP